MSERRWRVGVDSGGTFTDVCLFDEESGKVEVWKVPSTPDDPSRGIAEGVEQGMRRVAPDAARPAESIVYFGHGTTVATNALIQHRGVKTGLITTDGFRDLLEIGRQKRPDLYDLQADKPLTLVSYECGLTTRAYVEPIAVGEDLLRFDRGNAKSLDFGRKQQGPGIRDEFFELRSGKGRDQSDVRHLRKQRHPSLIQVAD